MDYVVALLWGHPCLGSHQSIPVCQREEHGVGVGSEFQFPLSECLCDRQGGGLSVTSMAIDAEVVVDGLPTTES